MGFQVTYYIIPLVLAFLLCLTVMVYLRGKRDIPGVQSFLVIIAGLAVWSFFDACVHVMTEVQAREFFDAASYLGIAIVPASWFLFTVRYTGRGVLRGRTAVAALYTLPAITLALAFTYPLHGLIWSSYTTELHNGIVVSAKVYGTWFWAHIVSSYIFVMAGIVLLLSHSTFSNNLFARQKAILLIGILLPWAGNFATLSIGMSHTVIDFTLLAFIFSCLAIIYGLFEYGLLDIVPLAQRNIFDNLSDAFVVIDAKGKVVEANKSSKTLLADGSDLYGRPFSPLLTRHPAVRDALDALPSQRETARITEELGEVAYETTVTPLLQGSEYLGAVILSRDITLRKRSEDTVKELNDMLFLINRILRHDISNNLTIARMSLELMDGCDPDLRGRVQASLDRSVELILRMKEFESAVAHEGRGRTQRLVDLLSSIAAGYPSLHVDINGKTGLMADTSLYVVFENIIRNAYVHGNADLVTIDITETPDLHIVAVGDNGTGLSSVAKEHAFDEGFSYGRRKGTGMGLYIVKKLMEQQGGSVEIGDNYPRGALVTVKIKKEKKAANP